MKSNSQGCLKKVLITAIAVGSIMGGVGSGYADTDGTTGGKLHRLGAIHGNSTTSFDLGNRKYSGSIWHGAAQAEWTQRWWQWWMSIPLGVSPTNDTEGAQCGINQSEPVWFIGGPLFGTFTRSCTIPKGKAILSPIVDYINDYPCRLDPAFKPAPGQTLENFLITGVTPIIDGFTVHTAELDGRTLHERRITTDLFSFTGAADLVALDTCVTGSPQLGVSDGYFIFIEPLSVGQHTLHIHSELPGSSPSDGTYNLTITE